MKYLHRTIKTKKRKNKKQKLNTKIKQTIKLKVFRPKTIFSKKKKLQSFAPKRIDFCIENRTAYKTKHKANKQNTKNQNEKYN